MSREDPQLKIRLPLELKEKIIQSAADHGRSINSEVVARLEDSFKESDDPKTLESLAKIVKETTEETTRLHKELVKIIEQQKIEIENLKKG
ncbi:Arc family DNA-binding protein [Acinetobacter sp. YH12087]|uniref:Arc family DNA-binding protein n=1 Tax=Acinetobacter sp. YH12087 TaxID=2601079 RepID=UPI0015D3C586|nr:Arc family DNA-binding protein [Acinetobacter sp. YH12087]